MSVNVRKFLEKIGLRALTDAEARELHLLRLREGKGGILGLLDTLAKDETAEKKKDDKKD